MDPLLFTLSFAYMTSDAWNILYLLLQRYTGCLQELTIMRFYFQLWAMLLCSKWILFSLIQGNLDPVSGSREQNGRGFSIRESGKAMLESWAALVCFDAIVETRPGCRVNAFKWWIYLPQLTWLNSHFFKVTRVVQLIYLSCTTVS